MTFQPGNKLSPGRPPGSLNKADLVGKFRKDLEAIGVDAVFVFKAFWKSWEGIQDQAEKARLAIEFLEFLQPKIRHHQISMTPEEAVRVLEEEMNAGRNTVDIEPISSLPGEAGIKV